MYTYICIYIYIHTDYCYSFSNASSIIMLYSVCGIESTLENFYLCNNDSRPRAYRSAEHPCGAARSNYIAEARYRS